ncbi:SRPBCC family protein [Sorangium sp. So ce1389]|uniref:SRPBCC family protein n=1 Tax=Sorangium sp. So ce1389 TaxID=3133336 RepID=UPI003F5D88AB
MKVLTRVGLGLLAVVLLFVIAVMTRPPTFRVERSATVAAPAEVVYAHVVDFHAWQGWSPWERLDPSMQKTYGGPASGTGASYAWSGNDDVGEGKMTITDAKQPSNVTIRLEFIKPIEATNTTTFAFAPAPGGTKVTWAMEGENSFIGKAFGMFMDMDKMIGADFERGLGAMKQIVESKAAPPS